jgi:hypothetical protein
VRRSRLRWYGHVLRKTESDGTRRVLEVVLRREGQCWDGRRKQRRIYYQGGIAYGETLRTGGSGEGVCMGCHTEQKTPTLKI